MNSVFEYNDYREYLRDLSYGPSAERGIQSELSRAMGCQASYFLQVLKARADLTEDHGVRLCAHLHMSELEAEYFLVILRMARAGSQELVKFLEKKRQVLLQQSGEIENKVKSKSLASSDKFQTRYFSSWIPGTIHMATSSENFQTPEALSSRLGLSHELVIETLQFLEQAGLVKKEGRRFVYSGGSIHLPRKSDLNEAHHTSRRLQALKSVQLHCDDDLHFSSIFTLDKKIYQEIKKLLSEAIKETHEKIHSGGTDEIYSMCIDLFRVV